MKNREEGRGLPTRAGRFSDMEGCAVRTMDLFLFAGQSNMAGRGVPCERYPERAPAVTPGAGWEFRAVSDSTRLYPLEEPFGKNENRPEGIHEEIKTGSMVSAFANAYYAETHVPVVGVSASKGGSSMVEWQPGSLYLTDALERLKMARSWLISREYSVRHVFVLWCQGETDGDLGTPKEAYQQGFDRMLRAMRNAGAERLFLVRVGHYNGPEDPFRYVPMMRWQEEIARTRPDVTMASRLFSTMRERGLMKDAFHYYQAGYNEVGWEAGVNTAAWVLQNT